MTSGLFPRGLLSRKYCCLSEILTVNSKRVRSRTLQAGLTNRPQTKNGIIFADWKFYRVVRSDIEHILPPVELISNVLRF